MKYILLFALSVIFEIQVSAQTPVHYYPFNANANDAIGTLNGVVNGATLTADRFGNPNSAYSFNGTSDNISFNAPLSALTNNFTITAWVKPANTNDGTIIYNGSSPALNGYGIQTLGAQYNGVFNGTSQYAGSTPPVAGAWMLVTLVKQDSIKLYVNGVSQSIKILSVTPATPSLASFIGSLTATSGYWSGSIDEVKVYETALSAGQIQQDLSPVLFPISAGDGGPGAGTCTNTLIELNNGGSATGLGCGGGSAGWYGGNGGNGLYGGGGAGAAGYRQIAKIGGDGGIGVVIIRFFDASDNTIGAQLLTSGTSKTVPAGAVTAKIWAIGAGGGGAGAGSGIPGSSQSANDPTAGGGGGAGGVVYKTYNVVAGTNIDYTLGIAGAGGVGPNDGQSGTATTVTYAGSTITGTGGAGGIFNTGGVAAGGSFSGGDGGADGGTGQGAAGDVSGGSGGGIAGGTSNIGTVGCGTGGGYVGSNSNDVGDLFATLSSTVTLPLSLIYFTANLRNDNVFLQWKIADEGSIDHFELEKSNNIYDFNKIFFCSAGEKKYSFIDNDAFSKAENIFYRLKSVEKSGNFMYSKILLVSKASEPNFSADPNPVKELLILRNMQLHGNIRLYNVSGKLILEQNVVNQTTTINMGALPAGVYLLKYQSNDAVVNRKIVKQ